MKGSGRIRHAVIPLLFLGILLFSLCFASLLPDVVQSYLYAISLAIKDCLIFSLPFVIFALVFGSMVSLGDKAMRYVLIIVPLVCCSNFMNTLISYTVSLKVTDWYGGISALQQHDESVASALSPAFEFSLKNIISNDLALCAGVILGLLLYFINKNIATTLAGYAGNFTRVYFKILIPVMPFFIAGTTLKLQHDGVLIQIFEQYLQILIVFIVLAYGFVLLQYLALARFKFNRFIGYLKNILPAIVTAFGSMSSASALPLSIKAAEANVGKKSNAGVIVPSTVNIHLVGDCFFIPMIAIAVMSSFDLEFPTFATYLVFALHFVIAKFAVAAVPGGGVLVMLPVMQKYLGMSSEMLALVTALYVLFDPIITACNVTGNGALAIFFDKITRFFIRSESK
ncbi:MAG: dicarboxylate/amino acid:cation symporter [Holosporales bacterium]|jgi:Na+/H+-dicarboxylate symporter|nr:dicarboxylate/amino acid:cation symporter [Holosporales bacterium]